MSETLRLIIWGGGSACKNHYTMVRWWSLPNNCNKALQGGGKFTDFTVIYILNDLYCLKFNLEAFIYKNVELVSK